jgi:hypothetical protein
MTTVSLSVFAVLVGPFAAVEPGSLVKNTILFPLGLASVTSQAVSPLPGHLIAETGHVGRLCVIAALVLTAIVIGASLIFRPPRHVPAAATRLIVALTVMFVLAPATRFGYFIYPGGILVWLLLCLLTQPAYYFAPDGLGPPPDPAVSGRLPPRRTASASTQKHLEPLESQGTLEPQQRQTRRSSEGEPPRRVARRPARRLPGPSGAAGPSGRAGPGDSSRPTQH